MWLFLLGINTEIIEDEIWPTLSNNECIHTIPYLKKMLKEQTGQQKLIEDSEVTEKAHTT